MCETRKPQFLALENGGASYARKKKEKKLIVKEGEKLVFKEVVDEIKNILKDESDGISSPMNFFYTDTYYDDDDFTLFNQGGSLKIREGVFPGNCYSYTPILVMRIKTTNLKKIEYTEWDEVEVPFKKADKKDFSENFYAIQGFFPNFDFGKINQEPVLKCKTSRTQYQIIRRGDVLTLMFDHIEYEANGKTASDDLLKIRCKSDNRSSVNDLYKYLREKFNQYELIEASRYERALQKLSEN